MAITIIHDKDNPCEWKPLNPIERNAQVMEIKIDESKCLDFTPEEWAECQKRFDNMTEEDKEIARSYQGGM
jgi:hypothetical protein